jgi:hypothetical protein
MAEGQTKRTVANCEWQESEKLCLGSGVIWYSHEENPKCGNFQEQEGLYGNEEARNELEARVLYFAQTRCVRRKLQK